MDKYIKLKEGVSDNQLHKFQGYHEIQNAFLFTNDFSEKLDGELGKVIDQFKNRVAKTREEIDQEKAILKELGREKKILDKVSKEDTKYDVDDDLRSSISESNRNKSRFSPNKPPDKLRESLISEVEINKKHTANKKLLDRHDVGNYERMERGEIESQISNILYSDNGENPYKISPPKKKEREVLDSSFEDLASDDESVYNTYWEEFEEREKRKVQRSIDLLHDPMMLLEKMQGYSKNLYKNLTPDDKNQLMRQIEKFLDEGVTPLQKYYDELRSQFSVPSK